MDRAPSKKAPAYSQEVRVPAMLRVRGDQIIGIEDHKGNVLGMPLTLSENSSGGVGKIAQAFVGTDGSCMLAISAQGEIVPAGMRKSLQQMSVSSAVTTAMLYIASGETTTGKYWLDRSIHGLRAPVRFDLLMADINDSNSNQRMPGACLLNNDGRIARVLCIWAQIIRPNGGGDGNGVRLVQTTVTIDLASQEMTMGPIKVFSEPSNWTSFLGNHSAPELIKLASGRVLAIYNRNDAANGQILPGDARNIYLKYSDNDGETWSTGTKLFDATTSFAGDSTWSAHPLVPGCSGKILQIPAGPNAGRLLTTIYTSGGNIRSIYSDDSGSTWLAGTPLVTTGYTGSESSITYRSDGSLIMSFRATDTYTDMRATSTDGGVTWTLSGPVAGWVAGTCARSMISLNYGGPADGPEHIVWQGPATSGSTLRENIVVRLSYDGGATYQHEYHPLDPLSRAGYSCIVSLGDGFFFSIIEGGFNDYCVMVACVFNKAEMFK